ncbi:DeoR/GlpR family DNA-binding transcription regulator [Luteolibacter sp. LG18]|uniref:DeoR/GlpR family DNA-binding transcription regulator n=1 Tax=Luteolibacter sp. LG18 TaxID=2819286 RepID=UPI002B2C1410|nr:putative HTH-type transcriptional regulator YulB [Luteolibacter sp. LG18]
MLPVERQNRILKLARRDGTVRTIDLAKDFDVAEETIRRDLDFLSRRGHLKRTHGGAMDNSGPLAELPYSEREARQLNEKVSMAKEAARVLCAGETILLDASSTSLQLASHLPAGLPLRVVSHSLAVMERLASNDSVELIQLGGTYEPRGRRYNGLITELAVRALRIDRFFFSGGGLDPVRGLSEPNSEQARLKRVMLDHSAWKCALIDHTKMGVQTDFFFAQPQEVDLVITDNESREYAKEHLKNPPFTLKYGR